MPRSLPTRPHLDWLKRTARQRLVGLRAHDPSARLHTAQLLVARDYGFASWRALRAHVLAVARSSAAASAVFAAARDGDVEGVERALASGFDPAMQDADGRTLFQIAKEAGHGDIEILVRDHRTHASRSVADGEAVRAILRAAQAGDADALRDLLDARPDLIDAMGGGLKKAAALHLAALNNCHAAIRLLLARGADVDLRDFPDNAAPLHLAAFHGDLETIGLLIAAGADVQGEGDDYGVGILGWATCFQKTRTDVAEVLLAHGAALGWWSAIALDRADAVRALAAGDPSLLHARMSRNQHRRTALHHAAAKDRPRMLGLLLDLGADPTATDAAGATPLTTASLEGAGTAVVAALLAAGAPLDFLTAVNLGRFAEAEAMLASAPARLGLDGADTIALHLAISKKNAATVRWLIAHGVALDAKRVMWGCNHTALHMTVENGDIALARLLLDAGADPNVKDDKFDATALGWARYFGRADLAALITERGGHT